MNWARIDPPDPEPGDYAEPMSEREEEARWYECVLAGAALAKGHRWVWLKGDE